MKCNLKIILMVALFIVPLCGVFAEHADAKQTHSIKKHSSNKTTAKHSVKKKKTSTKHSRKPTRNYVFESKERFSALVVNASNGKILYEKNAGGTRYPASLTKMMTLYLTFEALNKNKLEMTDTLPVSRNAASQPQTNISLDAGDRLSVKTAIESVIVRSANDSAMVLAEAIGGSEDNFANMMTKKAKQLGMKNTVFRNPNGLPDNGQITTAYDMAKLGIALRRDFPNYYPLFKTTEFTHNGITYPGHNRVMNRYDGVDGIKTGYIRASGFNLVTSVKKDGYSLVAVIMGGESGAIRDNQMIDMLDKVFSDLEEKQQKFAELNNHK